MSSNPENEAVRLWLDIGNTCTHWWLNDGDQAGVIPNDRLLNDSRVHWGLPAEGVQIDEIICASVGSQDVVQILQRAYHHEEWRLVKGFPHRHLTTVYDPEQLGLDRWLAMLGALGNKDSSLERSAKARVVVDAGTALTVDVLDQNHHQGGWIMPGLVRWHQVLYGSTQIRRPMVTPQSCALGKNTEEAIAQAWLAAVQGLLSQALKMQPNADILLTGGDAPLLKTVWQRADYHPSLVWTGMKIWRTASENKICDG